MSELSNIFGGGAEHAHEQAEMEKVLPAPAPVSTAADDDLVKDHGVSFPPIGLPGEAIAYEPFKLKNPDDEDS